MSRRRPGSAPSGGSGAGQAGTRGAILIAFAVVLGIALLLNSYDDDGGGPFVADSGNGTPAASDAGDDGDIGGDGQDGNGGDAGDGSTTTEAPAAPHDPSEVKVLVLNGTTASGVAGRGADTLSAASYVTLDPTNAAQSVTSSVVYYLPGFEADAVLIAGELGLPGSSVQAMPTPLPPAVSTVGEANVVVVLGPDAPAVSD